MRKGFAALLAVAVLFLSACNCENQEWENTETGKNETAGETLAATTEAELSDERLSEALCEWVVKGLIYMCTDGAQEKFGYSEQEYPTGAGYVAEVSGDEIQDWIIGGETWFTFICNRNECYGAAFENGNAFVTPYVSEKGQLLFMQERGTVAYTSQRLLSLEKGEITEIVAATIPLLEGSGEPEYFAFGLSVDKPEHERTIQNLGEMTELQLAPFSFSGMMEVPYEKLSLVEEALLQYPFITAGESADIDQDGDEEIIFFFVTDESGPKGMNIQYWDGSPQAENWAECSMIIKNKNGLLEVEICSYEKGAALLEKAEIDERIASGEALLDGTYSAIIYEDKLYDTAQGLCGLVDIRRNIIFDNATVEALKVGDVLELQEYGMDNIAVDKMQKIGNENAFLIDQEHILIQNNGESLYVEGYDNTTWFLMGDNDRLYEYTEYSLPVIFAENAIVIDKHSCNYGYGESDVQVENIKELFQSPAVESTEMLQIVVQDGKIIQAVLYYHP